MRVFTITAKLEGAAFDDDAAPFELGRILAKLADEIEEAGEIPEHRRLYDINGNHIGYAQSKEA